MNTFSLIALITIFSLSTGCNQLSSKPEIAQPSYKDLPIILTVPSSALPPQGNYDIDIIPEKKEMPTSLPPPSKQTETPFASVPLTASSTNAAVNEETLTLVDLKHHIPPEQAVQTKIDKEIKKSVLNKIEPPIVSEPEKKKSVPTVTKKEKKLKLSKVEPTHAPKPEKKKAAPTVKKETVPPKIPPEQAKLDLITQVTYPGCQNEQTDLWCRIRLGYKFQVEDNEAIQEAIAYFAEAQTFFDKVVNRARPYLYYVVREIEAQDLPLELALLPVIESAYRTTAVSPKAAAGLWQFIPSTGEQFGLTQNEWYDARYDVVASTRAALKYLKQLHKKFKGDWFLALAAYNWGQGNITKAIEKNTAEGKPTDYWSLDLPTETRQYVPRLIAVAEIVAHPRDYGINLKSIASRPHFKQIEIDQPISLEIAADLADMTVDDFKYYNATHLQETTALTGAQRFTLPINHADQFKKNMASKSATDLLPPPADGVDQALEPLAQDAEQETEPVTQLVENVPAEELEKKAVTVKEVFQLPADKAIAEITQYYQVKRGDTLWHIAKRHNMKLSKLQTLNGFDGRHLKVGQKIKLGGSPPTVVKKMKAFLIPKQRPTTTQQHAIRKKETLWRIAKRYKTTVPLLRALNDLQGQSLTVGATLKIPVPEAEEVLVAENEAVNDTSPDKISTESEAEVEEDATEEIEEDAAKKKIVHTVKSGESLWLIARYYRVDIDELMEWNSLQKRDALRSGQKLTIWQDG